MQLKPLALIVSAALLGMTQAYAADAPATPDAASHASKKVDAGSHASKKAVDAASHASKKVDAASHASKKPDTASHASKKADTGSHASSSKIEPAVGHVPLAQDNVRKVQKLTTLAPNHYSFVDYHAKGIVYNGHEYHYDTMSGPTLIPSRKVHQVKPMDMAQKQAKMYWTAEPPLGLIEGEYYGLDFPFKHGNLTFEALADLVVNNGRIVHLEMDERLDPNYYDKYWAGNRKRRSGYTFFQQSKGRTDDTLVTWGNGITFLEYQVIKHNSLNFPLSTVYGSSNSARDAFIPAIGELNKLVSKPSGEYYIGLTQPLANGVLARLQLIFKGKKIIKASYDEIFPDTQAQIKDPALKKYYRTSKYEGLVYKDDTKGAFRAFADKLTSEIVAKNSLHVFVKDALPEFKNYEKVAKEIAPAVKKYLAKGYKHNIGSINKMPKGFKVNPALISRKGDIKMEVVKTAYDEKTSTATVTMKVTNVSKKVYDLKLGNFYMYALSTKNNLETVGSQTKEEVNLKPGMSKEVNIPIKPIYKEDRDFNLKYDGPNKIYFEFPLKKL